MKKYILIAAALMFSPVAAHADVYYCSGDGNGGHLCWKKCATTSGQYSCNLLHPPLQYRVKKGDSMKVEKNPSAK